MTADEKLESTYVYLDELSSSKRRLELSDIEEVLSILNEYNSNIDIAFNGIGVLVDRFPPILMDNYSHDLIKSIAKCHRNCETSFELTDCSVELLCVLIQFGSPDTMTFLLNRLDSFRFDDNDNSMLKILRRMFVTLTHWALGCTHLESIEMILSRCYSRAECLHNNEELLELYEDVTDAMKRAETRLLEKSKKKMMNSSGINTNDKIKDDEENNETLSIKEDKRGIEFMADADVDECGEEYADDVEDDEEADENLQKTNSLIMNYYAAPDRDNNDAANIDNGVLKSENDGNISSSSSSLSASNIVLARSSSNPFDKDVPMDVSNEEIAELEADLESLQIPSTFTVDEEESVLNLEEHGEGADDKEEIRLKHKTKDNLTTISTTNSNPNTTNTTATVDNVEMEMHSNVSDKSEGERENCKSSANKANQEEEIQQDYDDVNDDDDDDDDNERELSVDELLSRFQSSPQQETVQLGKERIRINERNDDANEDIALSKEESVMNYEEIPIIKADSQMEAEEEAEEEEEELKLEAKVDKNERPAQQLSSSVSPISKENKDSTSKMISASKDIPTTPSNTMNSSSVNSTIMTNMTNMISESESSSTITSPFTPIIPALNVPSLEAAPSTSLAPPPSLHGLDGSMSFHQLMELAVQSQDHCMESIARADLLHSLFTNAVKQAEILATENVKLRKQIKKYKKRENDKKRHQKQAKAARKHHD